MSSKSEFITFDGIKLDIIVSESKKTEAILIIYPCIGGNTRIYMAPVDKLLSMGLTVIQYNPRTHGKSEGQISMEIGLKDLYYFLSLKNYINIPTYFVGHSAGCNAILQTNPCVLNIRKYYLVEPVLSFRESMKYMYRIGTYPEFIKVISKWAIEKVAFENQMMTEEWLNISYWYKNNVRQQLDNNSSGFKIGTFLENFYIPGFNTHSQFIYLKKSTIVFLAQNDNWYPIKKLSKIVRANDINHYNIKKAVDHYFFMAWNQVWELVLEDLQNNIELYRTGD